MKKTFGILFISILLIGSCLKDYREYNSSKEIQVLNKGSFNFVKNAQVFNEAKLNRSETYSAPFDITKVERIGEILNITVSFSKGCDVSKFDLVWNGNVMESYPTLIALFLKRTTSNCGTPGEMTTLVLEVDLVECIGNDALVRDSNILVSNCSKKSDTNNSDISVSNRN